MLLLPEGYGVKIIGTGRHFPERVVTNDDLSKVLDTSDEWITQRTGIKQRRYASPKTSTASLGSQAALKAMKAAGVKPDEIDLILFATVTPDLPLPFCAALAQRELGLEHASGFDVTSGCAGFVQGVQVACQFIQNGASKTALVIGADLMTTMMNPKDRKTAVVFGDGAGAAVLSRTPENESSDLLAIVGGLKGNDTSLVVRLGGALEPLTPETCDVPGRYLEMDGRAVFRFAVDRFTGLISETCEQTGISPTELKLVVPHQVNLRILESAMRRCEVPMDRVVVNLQNYGNCAGASVPIALDEALRAERAERGDYILLVAFGSGLAWAATLFRY